jgi:hypothetical protein
MYVKGKSLRGIVEILDILNEELQWGLEEYPSYTSICNWYQKSGLYIYNNTATKENTAIAVKDDTETAVKDGTAMAVKDDTAVAVKDDTETAVKDGTAVAVKDDTAVAVKDDTSVAVKDDTAMAVKDDTETATKDDTEHDCAVIMDESMMIGSEKLLLIMGVPALKTGEKSLTAGDVRILDMEVKKSWNSAGMGEELDKVKKKMGTAPAYVISDNASTINKAVRDKGHIRVHDIGHTFGLFLQQTYEKTDDFKGFIKETTQVKFKEIMRPPAYLLPPKQRTVARFMNLSDTVFWAGSMMRAYEHFNEEEKEVFSFIKEYQPLINEMKEVFETVNPVLQRFKNEGMSLSNADWALSKVKSLTDSLNQRISAVGRLIEDYINTEYGKLAGKYEKWHIASDIIESAFGYYKARKSPNAMNGVTKQIFLLPLMTQIKKLKNKDFKTHLENIYLKDLDDWKDMHLSVNRTVMRKKLLSAEKAVG